MRKKCILPIISIAHPDGITNTLAQPILSNALLFISYVCYMYQYILSLKLTLGNVIECW